MKCNNKLHKCNLGKSLPLKVFPDLFRSLSPVLRKIMNGFEHCCVHGCHERGHRVSRPPIGDTTSFLLLLSNKRRLLHSNGKGEVGKDHNNY